jgi:hypothetical protein
MSEFPLKLDIIRTSGFRIGKAEYGFHFLLFSRLLSALRTNATPAS